MKTKRKVIIDTDGGSDDAIAIAMCLKEKSCEVLLISTVAGNVECLQAAENVLTTLEYCDTYFPPVYLGAKKPLKMPLLCAYDTHGIDGLGDKGFKPKYLKINKGNAIDKLIQAIEKNDEVEIITLGPLTNIALAIKKAPQAMRKVKKIVAMASSGLGFGNMSAVAEFNIYQDALAASQVLNFGFKDLTFVGWDACLGKAIFNKQEIDRIAKGNKLGNMLIEANATLIEFNQKRFGYDCLDLADPAAMVAFLKPSCISKNDSYYCQIDYSNGIGYGQVLIDYYSVLEKEPNCKICSKLKTSAYKNYLFSTLEV